MIFIHGFHSGLCICWTLTESGFIWRCSVTSRVGWRWRTGSTWSQACDGWICHGKDGPVCVKVWAVKLSAISWTSNKRPCLDLLYMDHACGQLATVIAISKLLSSVTSQQPTCTPARIKVGTFDQACSFSLLWFTYFLLAWIFWKYRSETKGKASTDKRKGKY